MIDQITAAAIYTVAEGSGLDLDQVIRANENAPAPRGLYSTVLIISDGIDGTGVNWYRAGDSAVAAHTRLVGQATASVQFYRTGAHDAAHGFRQWMESTAGIEYMEARGLAFDGSTDIRNLDFIVSTEYEERAGLDVSVRYAAMSERTVETIQQVNAALVSEQPEAAITIRGDE